MASSSSTSPSAPAFSSQSWKYHVFISFRGEDTRKTFVDHLYTTLERRGIYTYKDDETLPRGELIDPSLLKAIEESQIALIVFSVNYADSSWCLNELAHIMKCMDTRRQIVMPVFYNVEPSVVRKQKQKYGEALVKYELENKANVKSWREALVSAGNISGWETKHIANGHEAKGIEEIVDTITHRLHPLTSSVNDDLIGMETRVQQVKLKLQIGLGGVCMIGIWGVAGGGKTTLASSIYDEISSNFDGCSFVENIREESIRHGLVKLQEKILLDVLKLKQAQVGRVDVRKGMMMDRLRRKKVLIVLDDVDHLVQLKVLSGSPDWFGEGSRIIITTRDKHLLNVHKVNVIHDISLLNDEEASTLFRKHSPLNNRPMKEYEVLSKDVVSYARGLPLALTVLGCFLCDKEVIQWRSALDKFKETPDPDILEVLKISYDGLQTVQKELFLDIACFFRGVDQDKAMKMHDACGFHPNIEVKVLIQKGLVIISNGKFDMHNLVQEMGHYIVRGEDYNNPEKHSRVWKKGDVLKLCSIDAMTELGMIKAIRFRFNGRDPVQRLPLIVANMKNIRSVDWGGDLARPLPTNFSPRQLCCLTLEGISQEQLWEGNKNLLNLKMMELYGLRNLMMTPDFDGLPNLERFKLTKCWYLEEIHPSIGRLEHLAFLSIEFCHALTKFPPITQLKKLNTLTFSRCPKLFKLSDIQQQNMNHIGLRFSHRGLRKFGLINCDLGDEHMSSAVWELPNLQELDLTANIFSSLNFSSMRLSLLKRLNVSKCDRLLGLSNLPSSIAVLIADGCISLDTFGDVSVCKWLWNVSHGQGNKVGGDMLLLSMLQGNAIEDHFISVAIEDYNPEEFVGRPFRGKTFTLNLPHDWYNDYSGFLICVVTDMKYPHIDITIKQDVGQEDSQFELWRESNYEPEYSGTTTYIGYVSFNSLRHTLLFTSSYNIISFSVEDWFWGLNAVESYVGAELVPRKNNGRQAQTTTNRSEFWDEERQGGNTFTIQHDSESSIKIQWAPCVSRPFPDFSRPLARL